ncbi:MAG: hypothetical protein NC253_10080 [Ruminococcus sp.]|nr:hypothetical protein [Ruminococcus sp.]MCM1381026.1 hypothetical protein [Muribaculaceae bacterium]MCM1479200.1 hypothetical protein [Muribaculaceae bacterium]
MSTRELAYSLIDRLPERQLEAVVEILKGLSVPKIPEVEPDEWDLEMIKRAEEDNDGETISIEDLAKELGIDYDSL